MAQLFSGRADINYLCLLSLSAELLGRIADALPGGEVRHLTEEQATELTPADWAQVDVLHTSTFIPDPVVAPRLRWVQLDTSGADHLRKHPIWASDIPITTIGGISPVPLAEYVMWAVLGSAHRLPALLEIRDTRRWPNPAQRWQHLMPAPVRGATIGIIGYGRIGREIGRLADSFGMHVLGLSRTAGQARRGPQYGNPSSNTPDAELLGPDRLPELMARSDYVVVIVPLTNATANLVDATALRAAKHGSVLINVARGGIVDEDALRREVRSGRIRGAVLDVFDDEPLVPDNDWWHEPAVFLTPHVSGLAPAYETGVGDIVCENLGRFQRGEQLMNLVDRARGY